MKRALIVLMLLSLGGGWMLYLREHNAFLAYKQQYESGTTLKQLAQNQTSAIFERLDGQTMYFKTPIQTVTKDGTFINYQEQIGTMDDSTVVINVSGSESATALQSLAPETPLSLELVPDPDHPGWSLIKTIYITE